MGQAKQRGTKEERIKNAFKIESHIIENAGELDEVSSRRFTNKMSLVNSGNRIKVFLLKTTVNDNFYYVGMAGGTVEVENDDANLTEIGRYVLMALITLNTGTENVVLQEIKGTSDIRKKVINYLLKHPSGTKVCFVGDMSGELDGVLINEGLNLQKGTVIIELN